MYKSQIRLSKMNTRSCRIGLLAPVFLSCSDLFPLTLIQWAESSVTWTRAFASALCLGFPAKTGRRHPAHSLPRLWGLTKFGACRQPSGLPTSPEHHSKPNRWRAAQPQCPNLALRRRSSVYNTLYLHRSAPRFCRPSNTLRCDYPSVNSQRRKVYNEKYSHRVLQGTIVRL
ncbi:hypothetical protein FA13DRAFT_1157329 [Coprinellus micaceus]|uniref:Uncharacterized protein n=1 Tax=Coprinellus micaceus TaxID=71717 RepID=A0A4Y7SUF0_COPMI|nr:hypothetical protein FA13DRAFT_1157329 [Coprinellus micaceus]